MTQIRNVKLDNIFEGIAHERSIINAATTEEKQLVASALQIMQKKGTNVYKHAGVEAARVPGSERLRVRLTKQTGDADESDLEQPDEQEEEQEEEIAEAEEAFDDEQG